MSEVDVLLSVSSGEITKSEKYTHHYLGVWCNRNHDNDVSTTHPVAEKIAKRKIYAKDCRCCRRLTANCTYTCLQRQHFSHDLDYIREYSNKFCTSRNVEPYSEERSLYNGQILPSYFLNIDERLCEEIISLEKEQSSFDSNKKETTNKEVVERVTLGKTKKPKESQAEHRSKNKHKVTINQREKSSTSNLLAVKGQGCTKNISNQND